MFLDAGDSNSHGHQRLIAADVHLIGVTVIHKNIASRDADGLHSRDDSPHNFRRRTTSRRARGIDLNTDRILRLNELAPSQARVLLSRQFTHPLLYHLTNNGLRDSVRYDGPLV